VSGHDPVAELVLLCRAAAEADEDWRSRLHDVWVPGVVGRLSPVAVRSALSEWEGDEAAEDVAGALEAAVVSALAADGID